MSNEVKKNNASATSITHEQEKLSNNSLQESIGVTLRRVTTIAILFICIFLFVRTFALEPFGVPTGSMAPGLIGNHREIVCPRCRRAVVIGERVPMIGNTDIWCPNCGKRELSLDQSWEIPGDRLLVDKNVFNIRSPRRWEIAVFRCPVDTSKPYVKRIVGLPGESIQIVHGEIFVNGRLVRKTVDEYREVKILVFDQKHAPTNNWKERWLIVSKAIGAKESRTTNANNDIMQSGRIVMYATNTSQESYSLTYHNFDLEEKIEKPITDWLAYNGAPKRGKSMPVHDFSLSCDVSIQSGEGSFACRIGDGYDSAQVIIPITTRMPTQVIVDGPGAISSEKDFHFEIGQKYHFEFGMVDRTIHLNIDGRELIKPIELTAPYEMFPKRNQVSRPLQMAVRGSSIVIENMQLWRDVHYRSEGMNAILEPHLLADDEYFALGDNSSNSLDSREWAIPGIKKDDMIGKPFLIHQPLKSGRVTVNGDWKQFQTIDWDRLRWVR
jgi:signal peptidase I